MAAADEQDLRRVVRFLAEALWVQQQSIFDLISANASMEHVLRADYPEVFARYQRILDEVRSKSYPAQRTIIEGIEEIVDLARRLASA